MRSYEELTPIGRIRRMRGLARAALNAYGLAGARFKLIRQAGNTLFRVKETNPTSGGSDVYVAGEYMLRLHQPGYQSTGAIELELAWLAAMCREVSLPIPEPLSTPDGRRLVRVSIAGVPGETNCSILRWVRGRSLTRNYRPEHYRAQGRLMARLHRFSEGWVLPAGTSKRKYDWEGLFRDDLEEDMPASEAWSLLPREYVAPFKVVAGRIRQVMDRLGKGPAVYGLIHADLGLDANILFWRGDARAIDFDDSGFGYYAYDLSLALEHCQEDKKLSCYRQALLEGYTQVRPLPEEQQAQLNLFLAAYYVYFSLWAASAAKKYHHHKEELFRRMERANRLVQRYLERENLQEERMPPC
jgi:Ser/Thr protein kinase RdoA (MazF antagonist)